MQVDWEELATEVGAGSFYSSPMGLRAIEMLLGEDFFAQAVEYCINLDEGWMLVEGVLRILRPLGMKHCYHIYKTSHDLEKRRSAVWFLKYTSDRQVLEYIPEFLADPDEHIQRTVIEILDQMMFWDEIDYEDMISVLESAVNHPHEEVRKFALGAVSEDTIEGVADFTERLEEALWHELHQWQKRLKFETIHGFDLRCVPWAGQLQLSFLTDREDFDRSEAYSDEHYSRWRLDDLPHHRDEIKTLGEWMQKEFEKTGLSIQCVELFLNACVTALRSSQIQNIFHNQDIFHNKYNLSPDFQITVFSPSSSSSPRNYYSALDGSSERQE